MSNVKHNPRDNDVSLDDYVAAQMELNALRQERGLAPEEKGLSRMISSFFERRENRQKVLVSRKKLLLLAVFTGWMGGHRFYARQYKLGIFYLLLSWTGLPAAMTIIDLMEFIPVPPDGDGNILV